MAVPENIEELAHQIRTAIYGRDVRESMASGLEATADVADWARQVAQQIIDGNFDEGLLKTEIENKLNQLEQDYAPRLNQAEDLLSVINDDYKNSISGYSSLYERLSSLDNSLEEKVDYQTVNNEFSVRKSPQYGKLKIPEDFIALDFDLYRNSEGLINHSINIDNVKEYNNKIYVSDSGSNITGDGSQSKPYRTVHKAFIHIVDAPNGSYQILVNNSKIMRAEFSDEGGENFIDLVNKRVSVVDISNKNITHVTESQNSGRGTFAPTGEERQPSINWQIHQGDVYKTQRTAVEYVVDLNNINLSNRTVNKMKKVNDIQECVSTPNSFFKNDSEVYVHTFDSRQPDKNIEVILLTNPLQFNLSNSTLYFEGFYFHSNKGVLVQGDLNSSLYLNNCKIGRTTSQNGLNVLNVGRTYSLNTLIHDSFKDCFNYHYYDIPSEDIRKVLAFEYYCEGFGAGIDDDMDGNNVTTMHEGANILRVGVVGKTTRGTPCADINGSYSVLFDCHMSDSVADPASLYNNAYYFVTDVNKSGLGAKVYMENCSGKGARKNIMLDEGTTLELKSYHEGLEGIDERGGEVVIAS